MNNYRTEIRIFGLLFFALITTALLGVSLSDVQGDILGIKFNVVGPIGAFIVLILIFHATGLFKLGLDSDDQDILSHPVEKLSLEEIEDMIDEIDKQAKKMTRRKTQLEAAKAAKEVDSSDEAVLQASGMTPVKRPAM